MPTRTKLPEAHAQEVARAINEVVGRYARKTRHWYDERDLAQRAWVVALESYPKWDAARGPLAPYVAEALRRQLGKELVHDHAPVSASRNELYELYGVRGATLEALAEGPHGGKGAGATPANTELLPPEPTVERPRWADEVLADHQWHLRVSARLAEVVDEDGADGLDDLLREDPRPPASGRPTDRLCRSRAVACVRIAQDPELRLLYRER